MTDPNWDMRLTAELLEWLSDLLSRRGCNDYDLPEWADKSYLSDLIASIGDDDADVGLLKYDWYVATLMAKYWKDKASLK